MKNARRNTKKKILEVSENEKEKTQCGLAKNDNSKRNS